MESQWFMKILKVKILGGNIPGMAKIHSAYWEAYNCQRYIEI